MKNSYEKYHKEVTQVYLQSGRPLKKEVERDFKENKYRTQYRLYDLDRKKFAEVTKKGYSFSDLSYMEQAKIWSYIFKNTDYMGMGHLAIDHFKSFQNKKSHPLLPYWPLLKTWVGKIENWTHADMLASLYCDILTESPDKVYAEFKKWSQSPSPWKNRMAIVSLLYYYNPKRVLLPFNDIISLVKPHLLKDHYYLQKAIGWNLRELSRAYPKESMRFVQSHLYDLSPTAFTTAMEKIPKSVKEPLKLKRKEWRKQRGPFP